MLRFATLETCPFYIKEYLLSFYTEHGVINQRVTRKNFPTLYATFERHLFVDPVDMCTMSIYSPFRGCSGSDSSVLAKACRRR